MTNTNQLIVFTLDERRYALYLSAVERVVHAVEVTPLPKAPEIVRGIINMQGRIIPVLDIRKRFSLPERKIGLSDQLIIARTSRRNVALFVDTVQDVFECPLQDMVISENIESDIEYIDGVLKFDDGMVLIHNLDKFLYPEEEKMLEKSRIQNPESSIQNYE